MTFQNKLLYVSVFSQQNRDHVAPTHHEIVVRITGVVRIHRAWLPVNLDKFKFLLCFFVTMIITEIACGKLGMSWDNSKLSIISLEFKSTLALWGRSITGKAFSLSWAFQTNTDQFCKPSLNRGVITAFFYRKALSRNHPTNT